MDSPAEILAALRRISFGHLVSVGAGGRLESTAVPFVVDDDLTEIRAHIARANPHWRHLDGIGALMIVAGSDAYVSPRWYPSKAEHGRVVPTWNYEVVNLHGTIEVHDDASWTHRLVSDLTDQHEAVLVDPEHPERWEVTDAPSDHIATQLRAIVGVRMRIDSIEAKRKLSQNRPATDQAGVIAGLDRTATAPSEVAALMRSLADR